MNKTRNTQSSIAIIGMACKFPGANSKQEFWENLVKNKDCVHKFSDDELKEFEYSFDEIKDRDDYVKARGCIDEIDMWDAEFFQVIPKHAREMDPQQRLWLENSWYAFEDAGIDPFKYKGSIGVFAGSYYSSYLLNNVLRDTEKYELYIRGRTPELFQTYLNNDPMFLATRTAYFYNLRGPAVNIQTACSTSLVSISQACNSLFLHESDVCVSGGVTIIVPQETGYFYQEGAIGSPDGHCRPFDINGKGTVFGNGVGTVILKRLEDAERDNDRIYAVIKGWATNNDGNQKVGFTAPSIQGQSEVIGMALSNARVKPEDVCYIETHGTGTPIGDPIEFSSLSKVFNKESQKKQICGIGSVKSNIGHLDAAAGVAGLIKIALAASEKLIPATLHYKAPNSFINIKNSPFYVLNENLKWESEKSMIMGISSFGVGGTNAHLIVEEYNNNTEKKVIKKPAILLLSAHKENVLDKYKKLMVQYLSSDSAHNLNNLSYTLQIRRHHMAYRCFGVVNSTEDAPCLTNAEIIKAEKCDLVFMFPGQGSQYLNMGRELYEKEAFFKTVLDECFGYFEEFSGTDIKPIIFNSSEDATYLNQTRYTQPAIFIIEYALAKLFEYYAVTPDYSIGHSIGEYTAACLSGVFDLKTAISIVAKRGELMNSAQRGKMMAITSSAEDILQICHGKCEIAAINSPSMISVSYQEEDENELVKILNDNNVRYISLQTSHGFHSLSFDPILDEFEAYVNQFELKTPTIPFISCLSGDFITNEQACSGKYWANQLRNTVHFSKGIEHICANTNPLFLELGPNVHLSFQVLRNDCVRNRKNTIQVLGKLDNVCEQLKFYKSLGELWLRKIEVKFDNLHKECNPNIVDLPLYLFDKKRHWIDYSAAITEKGRTNIIINQEKVSDDIDFGASKITEHKNTNDTLKELVLIWQNNFGKDDIKTTDSFSDLGGESMLAFSLIADIERILKIKISFRDFMAEYNSIDKMHSFIMNKLEKEFKNEPLKNNYKHIYCLNRTGKNSPIFNVFSDRVFTEIDVSKLGPIYNFVWPGSEGKLFEMDSVEEIAQTYLNELLKVHPNGPFYLIGFSFGGLVAFEMALTLQKKGFHVPLLMLIDSKNPQYKVNQVSKYKQKINQYGIFKFVLPRLLNFIQRKIRIRTQRIEIFIISTFNLKKSLSADLTQRMILDEAERNAHKYHPGSFHGKLYLFRSSESFVKDKFMGWQAHASEIHERELEGFHLDTIYKKANKQIIITELKKMISEIENE